MAGEASLRAKARRNLKLGIMSGVYSEFPVEEAARRIMADGFHAVVSDFRFADVRFDPLEPNWDAARKIVSTLEHAGIEIVGIFGYYNLVDPDVNRRKLGEARMEAILSSVDRLGCRLVSTGTGSYNLSVRVGGRPGEPDRGRLSALPIRAPEARRTAEKHGAILTIEPYYKNVISSIERAERLFHEVALPCPSAGDGPLQLLPQAGPGGDDGRYWTRCSTASGDRVAIAHAKDVKPSPTGEELPAAGLGVLDYPLYLRQLARLDRPLPLVLEHLGESGVARAQDFVVGQFDKI